MMNAHSSSACSFIHIKSQKRHKVAACNPVEPTKKKKNLFYYMQFLPLWHHLSLIRMILDIFHINHIAVNGLITFLQPWRRSPDSVKVKVDPWGWEHRAATFPMYVPVPLFWEVIELIKGLSHSPAVDGRTPQQPQITLQCSIACDKSCTLPPFQCLKTLKKQRTDVGADPQPA